MAEPSPKFLQLGELHPLIREILSATGTAGASIGIIHRGETWSDHFGFRDHARSKAPDDDTLYTIGSLTKAMIAQAVATLSTKVVSIIPEFDNVDSLMTDHCTISDLLCQRSGLPTFNALWYQGGSRSLVQKRDLIPMVNKINPLFPLRSGWCYSNWGYALVGLCIERITGEPNIWKPLAMSRINADQSVRDNLNVAQGFSALPDLSLYPVQTQELDSESIMGAAGGYYKSLLDTLRAQDAGADSKSVLKQTGRILSGHVVFNPPAFGSMSENTYGYGWIKTRLPAAMGLLGDNPGLVASMPVLSRGAQPQTVFYHQGGLSGSTTCVILLPETETCIITMTNTRSIGDSADWIAQLLLGHITDPPEKHDFLQLARESARGQTARYPQAKEPLDKDKHPQIATGPLDDYMGRYLWSSECYFLDIRRKGDGLQLQICARDDQMYDLTHYQADELTWFMTYEEEQKRGRLRFKRSSRGDIVSLTWCDMGGGPGDFIKTA
ncbi:beta-lactamase/transpeptidase-like protein [Dissoconium aciculare CBS 342.82]|uniref:Beta-lactamase/transpeptidase-like protein n=1 Tax=Dissoconium aciculare CBS 342.82 TaxID=1314786 RepID=A0A6J3LRQ9_9PEZI|nr:beta-lactamase/transpeptidase-like protein [Dissoconium aciculare CBS 342.82]KAF1817964.1 beta-lactamase/transpeptidase-like protein [Dissoconium aciculare CBS 342.82]